MTKETAKTALIFSLTAIASFQAGILYTQRMQATKSALPPTYAKAALPVKEE